LGGGVGVAGRGDAVSESLGGKLEEESKFMDYRVAAGDDNFISILPANGYFAEMFIMYLETCPRS
jgi:hypothetical protein